MANKKKTVKEKFLSIFGITSISKNIPITSSTDNIRNLSQYNQKDLNSLFKRSQLGQSNARPSNRGSLDEQSINTFIMGTHNRIGSSKLTNAKLMKIVPELGKAETILVSSILSPVDMQKNDLNFVIGDSVSDIPELTEKLSALVNNFANKVLKLDEKLPRWLEDALFRTGAKPVLILPPQIVDNIYDSILHVSNESHSNMVDIKMNVESEYIDEHISNMGASVMSNESYNYPDLGYVTSQKFSKNTTHSKRPSVSFESITQSDDFNNIVNTSLGTIDKNAPGSDAFKSRKMQAGITEMTKKIFDRVVGSNSSPLIKISSNIEILHESYVNPTLIRDSLNKSLVKKYKKDAKVRHPKEEPIMSISDYSDYNDTTGKRISRMHPTLIELPTEAVIPVCTPGDPQSCLGYLIALDEYGYPLTANENNTEYGKYCTPETINSYHGTFFGRANKDINRDIVENLFDHVFSSMTENKLKSFGINQLSLIKHNEINKLLFYRLMGEKRTNILFVPDNLLLYLCYDYNEDGTGKSIIDDLRYPLSLKITLTTANVLANLNRAIDYKDITVNFDDKEVNVEGVLKMIKETFLSSHGISLSTDPESVYTNLTRNAVRVIPKNIPGMANFEVAVSEGVSMKNTSTIDASDGLLESIDKMVFNGLVVPPDVIDLSFKSEFSRSVASNNLVYARVLTDYQAVTCSFVSKIIRSYFHFDELLQDEMVNIISQFKDTSSKKIAEYNDRVKAASAKENIANKTTDAKGTRINKQLLKDKKNLKGYQQNLNNIENIKLHDIIDSITLILPTPKVSPDRAKYAEIAEYTDMVTRLADIVYDENAIVGGELHAKALRIKKSDFIKKNIRELLEMVGGLSFTNLSKTEETPIEEVLDQNQELHNFANGLLAYTNTILKLGADENEGEASGGDDSAGLDDTGDDFNIDETDEIIEDETIEEPTEEPPTQEPETIEETIEEEVSPKQPSQEPMP